MNTRIGTENTQSIAVDNPLLAHTISEPYQNLA